MTDQTPAGAVEAPTLALSQYLELLAAWMQDE